MLCQFRVQLAAPTDPGGQTGEPRMAFRIGQKFRNVLAAHSCVRRILGDIPQHRNDLSIGPAVVPEPFVCGHLLRRKQRLLQLPQLAFVPADAPVKAMGGRIVVRAVVVQKLRAGCEGIAFLQAGCHKGGVLAAPHGRVKPWASGQKQLPPVQLVNRIIGVSQLRIARGMQPHLAAGEALCRRGEGCTVRYAAQGDLRIPDASIQPLQKRRFDPVVRIDKSQKRTAGGLDAGVPRGRNALIFLVEDPDAAVLLREGLAEAGAFVRAAIIDQKQLEVRERLRQKAVDAVGQILLRPVHRYDHTDVRRCRDPHPQTRKIKSTTEREYRSGWERKSPQERPWVRGMVWPDILVPVPCASRRFSKMRQTPCGKVRFDV